MWYEIAAFLCFTGKYYIEEDHRFTRVRAGGRPTPTDRPTAASVQACAGGPVNNELKALKVKIMHENWKGFVFLNVSDDLLLEDHDLGHSLRLRKATLPEITDRQVEASFRMWSERRGTSVFIDQRMPLPNAEGSISGSVLVNPEEWRHAVIECSAKDVFFWNVNLAFSISSADLRMGVIRFENNAFSCPFTEFPMINMRNSLGAMFVDHKLPSLDDLPEIKQTISYVINNVNKNFPSDISQIIYMFITLDNLPDSSVFKVLGYFAVIEGLLSHAPVCSDRMDSIQRQLIRNINLLNNRLKKINREIEFSDFGETRTEKILTKFYAYRSAIAHGSNSESSLRDINNMRPGSKKTDHLWVHDWLRNMTKKLLLAAIIEPEIVSDLK